MNRMAGFTASLALSSVLVLAACQQQPVNRVDDTAAAGSVASAQTRRSAGISAANPFAVEAGLAVLRDGGSAVDAAVAVQAMLGLVEPQSSGLGGGAFMLHLDGKSGRLTAFDGRETAPAGATPDMFVGDDGKPLSYVDAVTSGRSTGAPGAIAMLGLAHERFGRLPWRELFATATHAAENGFSTPGRLAGYVNGKSPQVGMPDARALFSRPDGTPVQAGDILRNPAYAQTLRTIAAEGPRALLEGPIAGKIAARTREPPRPGTMTTADLAAYRPQAADALCRPYRVHVVCVPPPPSSGVSLLEMLAILERTDIASRDPDDPEAWFIFAEASRLMYADRDQYVADPAFVRVPVAGLLDPGYVAGRAALIGREAGPPPMAGIPPGLSAHLGRDSTDEAAGTSHFVVVDSDGNVVSMTTTVESLLGSGRAVDGFFLNNQLTDFSFRAVEDGKPVANAVAPGKRPRSSMSPVIVLDHAGRFFAALGSPGGSSILTYNAKTVIGLLDWGLSMQQAIDLPNLYARGADFYGEVGRFSPEVLAGLAERGVVVKSGRGEASGLHGVIVRPGGTLEGGADPRREGEWRELEFR
jgi:gamma-glutamyltranspeptidase/glutathione hydrolase